MAMKQRLGFGGAIGAALFCLALLVMQPVPTEAFAGCTTAGGPNGHCCACNEGG